jgi:serine-type D-Ala-D-Ala carboxypeptidase (penicillin-binding protein 5/6)
MTIVASAPHARHARAMGPAYPRHFSQRRRRSFPSRFAKVAIVLGVIVVVGAVVFVLQRRRPVPTPAVKAAVPAGLTVAGSPPAMPWPSSGEAAIDVPTVGMLSGPGSDHPVAIASLAKIMLAFVVLHDHPLARGAEGPGLTVTPADVALYRSEVGQQQSLVRISAGEVLTEQQVLEGLLVGSGNDLAGLVARWDRGSDAGLVAEMNAAASRLGLTHTHYNDTVGLDPATVSTPADQLRLSEAALADPAFATMVSQPSVTLPMAGSIANFNTLLGQDGVVGVKTGASTAAGGCLSVAALRVVGGRPALVYAVVLGQSGTMPIQAALLAGKALVDAAGSAVRTTTVLPAGTPVATVRVPWAHAVTAVTATDAKLPGWGGLPVVLRFQPARLGHSLPSGAPIGTLSVTVAGKQTEVPVDVSHPVPSAPLSWRLRRLP